MGHARTMDRAPTTYLAVTMTSEGSLGPDPAIPAGAWWDLSRQADDHIAMVDAGGACTWASAGAGLVAGRPLADCFHGGDHALASSLLAAGPVGPELLRLADEPDSIRWVSAVSVPLPDGTGWVVQLRPAVHADAHVQGASAEAITGVAGREKALDEVAWLLSATPRTGKEIAVACCGLDRFAGVGAQLGDDVGAEVLRVLAGRISDTLRSGDLVARLDDERLLVVMRGVHHLRGAIRVANKIRAVVEDPILLPSGELVQTMSVGVTLISRGESVDSVLHRAEGAMSMAQDSGGNSVMSSPPI